MVLEDRWLRETYVDLLIEYAAKNKDIVILEADLMKAGGTFRFAEKYPERTFDVGIQEANMIGTAAGMSAMGKIPFTHTFTAFATRRVCDQVTLSVAYAGLNVKMMGSDPGVTAEYNGGTHMSMEDVSIMRNIPGMIVYEPVDSAQLKAIFPQIVDHYGPVYIRLLRRNAVKVFEDGETFELGKGKLMREGSDVSIFANECIEFWFMLHFAYYTSNNHRSEYKKFLNEKFRELGIGKYEKNMDNIFETLMNGGSPKLAIRYARRIIKNGEGKTPAEIAPGTKVHELVEELAKYLPEEMQRKFKEN